MKVGYFRLQVKVVLCICAVYIIISDNACFSLCLFNSPAQYEKSFPRILAGACLAIKINMLYNQNDSR